MCSGDEAIEKSFMTSSCESSVWAKRNSKVSIFLSSVTVMKSMVGVGILGIVIEIQYRIAECYAQFWDSDHNMYDDISLWIGIMCFKLIIKK